MKPEVIGLSIGIVIFFLCIIFNKQIGKFIAIMLHYRGKLQLKFFGRGLFRKKTYEKVTEAWTTEEGEKIVSKTLLILSIIILLVLIFALILTLI